MTALTYRDRNKGEPLAQYLHAMAELFGADDRQRAVLARAAVMSDPAASAEDRGAAGRMAYNVQQELRAAIDAVVFAAQARGEKIDPYNEDGAVMVRGRDGLHTLYVRHTLTEAQFNTGLVYRSLVEAVGYADVGSQMGRLSGMPSAQRTSVSSLHASRLRNIYAAHQLDVAERAIGPAALPLVRIVAGEGQSLTSRAMGGHERKRRVGLLTAGLDRARVAFAETGGLRITGT